ncbi:hypothetical protein KFE19_16590 [Dysosmobacter sp. Marseille-Q4140]|nr:hypothetical protein KFE19_16590 [Dysosmobacter sp. Marseille-Q4140]
MMDDCTLALLGDRAAADRITERGELLPCPCCGCGPTTKVQEVEYGLSGTIIRCNKCGLSLYSSSKKAELIQGAVRNVPIENHTIIGIKRWNTRAPILSAEEMEMLEGVK